MIKRMILVGLVVASAIAAAYGFIDRGALALDPAALAQRLDAAAAMAQTTRESREREALLRNPAIDIEGYMALTAEAAAHRESRRLTEDEFIRMSAEPGVIVLDARSRQKYEELHIDRAINLSFPDITVDSLNQLIPDKNTRILIYCNNNFLGAESAFPTKLAPASLNISTYIALYTYGYRNIYELGPLIDINQSKLTFVSHRSMINDR